MPKSDAGEAAQLAKLYNEYGSIEGLGDSLVVDDEFADIMGDLGVDLNYDAG